MKIFTFLGFTVVLILILLGYQIIKLHKLNNDLVFFLITDFILVCALIIFFNYFQDLFLAFIANLFLFINTIFLTWEVKNIMGKYIFTLSCFSLITYMFCIVIDCYLIR